MTGQAKTADHKPERLESAVASSVAVKDAFCQWLSEGNAGKYTPDIYLSCIDGVSSYLIRRNILSRDLWEFAAYEEFKFIYTKVVNDKVFKTEHKKIHEYFAEVGVVFLEFLRTQPFADDILVATDGKHSGSESSLTITKAIICVLEKEQRGMTAEEIYHKIVENELYFFGAKNPLSVVEVQIERACIGSNYSKHQSIDYFRSERDWRGKKVYFLISSSPIPSENTKSDCEIWGPNIKQDFKAWMDSEGYLASTKGLYCNIIDDMVRDFKFVADVAIRESSSHSEAIQRFVTLLRKEKKTISAERTNGTQLFAALATFERFANRDSIKVKKIAPLVEDSVHPSLKDFVGFDEGKKGVAEILDNHFLTLQGYSNSELVWSGAQNSIPMFLNDNAINSVNDLWFFVVLAFKDEFVFSYPHIWQTSPDYPMNSQGLIIKMARENYGVTNREQIREFLQKVRLAPLQNQSIVEKDLLLFYDVGEFILSEMLNPNSERCQRVNNALDTLFSEENSPFVILRDIGADWFSLLPALPNGLAWTPMLLQELLRIRPKIGYRVVFPGLKGQALDTLGAAIVPKESGITTFADVVYLHSKDKYKLPAKLDSERLRQDLRDVGMLNGNELIYNMHKVLRDHRFAFSDENRTVKILER